MSQVEGKKQKQSDVISAPHSKTTTILGSETANRDSLVEEYYDYVSTVVNGLIRTMQLPSAMRDEF
jgi:hypothetical protein